MMDRKKTIYIGLAIIVLLAVALIASSSLGSGNSAALAAYDNVRVSSTVVNNLESVPNSVSNVVGINEVSDLPTIVKKGSMLTDNGKPEVLFIGAEYCPFCAAERWGMIIALMRFGTFSNLHYMTSSPSDVFSNTPTFTFYNSTYTSNYITFVPVEIEKNKLVNGTYPVLQTPNQSENQIFSVYNPSGSIPFIDFANRSVQVGSNYEPPDVLDGYNWTQISYDLHNSSTVQAQEVVGTANLVTAQICAITNNTPQSVCSQSYVVSAEKQLGI